MTLLFSGNPAKIIGPVRCGVAARLSSLLETSWTVCVVRETCVPNPTHFAMNRISHEYLFVCVLCIVKEFH